MPTDHRQAYRVRGGVVLQRTPLLLPTARGYTMTNVIPFPYRRADRELLRIIDDFLSDHDGILLTEYERGHLNGLINVWNELYPDRKPSVIRTAIGRIFPIGDMERGR